MRIATFTDQFPMIQQMSGDRPSRSLRMAVSCSSPFRYGRICNVSVFILIETCSEVVLNDIWTNGSAEDRGERMCLPTGLALQARDRDCRSARHVCRFLDM